MILENQTTLGPFKVDAMGLLSPASPTSFPSFAVRWRERLVRARMMPAESEEASGGSLELSAMVGRIPSTAARMTAPEHRDIALGAIRQLLRMMPQGWQLRLAPDHSVTLQTRSVLTLPVSAIGLVTEMSLFLLALTPYLDVLAAEGIGPGVADLSDAAGTANT
jgi:hypothetical protein